MIQMKRRPRAKLRGRPAKAGVFLTDSLEIREIWNTQEGELVDDSGPTEPTIAREE